MLQNNQGSLTVGKPSDIPNQATKQPLTFGQKLVGLTFNPSNDDNVGKAKQLCADLADLLNEQMSNQESTQLSNILLNPTYASILAAQMNVVKLLTLKY